MLKRKRNGQATAFASCFVSLTLFVILQLLIEMHPMVQRMGINGMSRNRSRGIMHTSDYTNQLTSERR
jgi:hypothetical protein